MFTSGGLRCAGLRAGSLAWRSVIAVFFLVAAVPADAQDGNWTGFYAGLNAGGAWGNGDTDIGCSDGGIFIGACAANAGASLLPSSASIDADGFIGGGQAGYNF